MTDSMTSIDLLYKGALGSQAVGANTSSSPNTTFYGSVGHGFFADL